MFVMKIHQKTHKQVGNVLVIKILLDLRLRFRLGVVLIANSDSARNCTYVYQNEVLHPDGWILLDIAYGEEQDCSSFYAIAKSEIGKF